MERAQFSRPWDQAHMYKRIVNHTGQLELGRVELHVCAHQRKWISNSHCKQTDLDSHDRLLPRGFLFRFFFFSFSSMEGDGGGVVMIDFGNSCIFWLIDVINDYDHSKKNVDMLFKHMKEWILSYFGDGSCKRRAERFMQVPNICLVNPYP